MTRTVGFRQLGPGRQWATAVPVSEPLSEDDEKPD
jgi:hypothetical protein